ncbi:hypothetical protein [Stieleria varia]|uniref:Uncharacterized protein n=1 Tax=Stieleria varia TaxID=2528005 RepID=A0A5C5ZQW9_9BACT|nr:hypothetical protein [Stieleria varia]TWT89616.1 hypothetical protein Pla52n_67440 [Stieleria varia]
MRLARPTKIEWLVIGVMLAVLVALMPPTPHHRETRLESCHLCGNCRRIVREFRWWRFSSETTEPVETFTVDEDHEHDWWQYASYYISYNMKSAGGAPYRYQDGRNTWTPSTP